MRTPASRHAIMAPTANTSLVATTAVGRGFDCEQPPHHRRRRRRDRSARTARGARRARGRPGRAPRACRRRARSRGRCRRSRRSAGRSGDGRAPIRWRVISKVAARLSKPMLGCWRMRIDAPGQHVGPAVVLEQREQRGIVMEADEHEGVDAAPDQLLGDAQLRRRGRSDARPAPANSRCCRARPAWRWWCARRARSSNDGTTAPTMRLRWLRSARAAPCGT